MTHYCYVIVASDGRSQLIAGNPDIVYGSSWRERMEDVILEWEQINTQGTALGRLVTDGWMPLRETPMAPEWTKNKSGVSHSLVVLQKQQA